MAGFTYASRDVSRPRREKLSGHDAANRAPKKYTQHELSHVRIALDRILLDNETFGRFCLNHSPELILTSRGFIVIPLIELRTTWTREGHGGDTAAEIFKCRILMRTFRTVLVSQCIRRAVEA